MKELKKLSGVKTISKNVQKNVNGGHCSTGGGGSTSGPMCPAGHCGQIIFPGTDYFCTPC